MDELIKLIITAFLAGLLGSIHCVGMCGGIVGLLHTKKQTHFKTWPFILSYNSGRLLSYMLAGALVALLGQTLLSTLPEPANISKFIVAGFMVLLGLYIAGWWPVLIHLERLGAFFWQYIQPGSQKLFPIRTPKQALGLGIIWGWLPCGLVYSSLAAAMVSGNAINGALVMLAFGLGTLPMLLLMGNSAQALQKWVQNSWVRRVAGSLLIMLALMALLATDAHQHH